MRKLNFSISGLHWKPNMKWNMENEIASKNKCAVLL